MSNERKYSPIGDLKVKEVYNEDSKSFEESHVDIKDSNGNVVERVQAYELKVYIPDDVDEAGIGEPSIVLKKDQFINARALSSAEEERLPDFLKGKVPCKLSVALNRKQYPKKEK